MTEGLMTKSSMSKRPMGKSSCDARYGGAGSFAGIYRAARRMLCLSRWICLAMPVVVGLLVGFLVGCSADDEDGEEAANNSINAVYADNYPMSYFANRIAGDDVEVRFPLPNDIDPAFWEPSMDAIREYQQARLLIFNGADYAKWAEHVSLPDRSIVRTADVFRNQWITVKDAVAHRHGPEGDAHTHDGVAFTTWLDSQLAIQQAEQAFQAMSETWPEHHDAMKTRWEALRDDLQELDQALLAANASYEGQPLLASHPVYEYLARRLDWNLQDRHWEPDLVPDDKEWEALDELLKEHPAKIMVWESMPVPETKSRLAERGVQCIVYEPCGNRPDNGRDFLEVMHANVTAWQAGIKELAP